MFIPLLLNRISLAICSPCWFKFKNSHRFSSYTWGIIILHKIFKVSIIIGKHCWRHGGIDLKSKITIDSYLSCLPKKNLVFLILSRLFCFQKRLPLIITTSKMECNKVIPLVLDKNRSLFLILSRFLHVFSNGYK